MQQKKGRVELGCRKRVERTRGRGGKRIQRVNGDILFLLYVQSQDNEMAK